MTRLDALCLRVPLAVVVLWSLTTVKSCTLTFAQLNISHQGCFPRKLLVRGCRGTCSSYTMPSQSVPGQLERFCQCCDVDHMRLGRARINCPNFETNPVSIQPIVVTMNIPRSCRCRPCTEIPEHVIPAEQELLPNVKRNYIRNVTQHGGDSAWNYFFGHRLSPTVADSDISEQAHLDQLIKAGKPFIYVQNNAFNFTVTDIN